MKHMVLSAESFDLQISQVTQAYLIASGRKEWKLAAHYLVLKNATIRGKSRVTDLKPCNPPSKTLRDEHNTEFEYENWCIEYGPIIEMAVTLERDRLLRGYDR